MTEQPDHVIDIGPIPPSVGGIIYQINLASGAVVTNPAGFGVVPTKLGPPAVIVTADGRVLAFPPSPPVGEQEETGFDRFTDLASRLFAVPKDELTS
jgi:hypothetical protein